MGTKVFFLYDALFLVCVATVLQRGNGTDVCASVNRHVLNYDTSLNISEGGISENA